MKKRLFNVKILSLLLAAAILAVSVCFGVSAAEATDSDLDIAYHNLSFESDTYIMYAIKSADPNVRLETRIETENGPVTKILSPLPEQAEIGSKQYTVFKFTGTSAKQMTDYVYARAFIDNGDEITYGKPDKFSILQYAYAVLGKTATASKDESLKALISAMLDYGAAAQTYKSYRTDRLANDEYVQIKVSGGILADGFNHGLFSAESNVTLTAPATDKDGVPFAKWTDESGATVAASATATVAVGSKNAEYTAVYGVPEVQVPTEGLDYTLSNDKTYYIVTIGTATDTDIVIPSEYNDLPVKEIGMQAFIDCHNITSISIPESVTTISAYAFAGCKKLTSITLPSGLTTIKSAAFSDCTKLTSITIPSSVTTIGQLAFQDCTGLSIYAEAAEKSSDWHENWNPDNRPVTWGYTAE